MKVIIKHSPCIFLINVRVDKCLIIDALNPVNQTVVPPSTSPTALRHPDYYTTFSQTTESMKMSAHLPDIN